jgi:hypothetical protein
MDTKNLLTKREIGIEVLEHAFEKTERVLVKDIIAKAKEAGVSRRTMQRIAGDLGIQEIHNGNQPSFWELKKRKKEGKVKS